MSLLTGAGFVSLPNTTNNEVMSRGEQDKKEQNNPALRELHE